MDMAIVFSLFFVQRFLIYLKTQLLKEYLIWNPKYPKTFPSVLALGVLAEVIKNM